MSGSLFRSIAVSVTSPTAWIGVLLILGFVLSWTKKQKLAKLAYSLGTILFITFAFDPFTEILLNNYENRYPAFSSEIIKPNPKIEYVVVLAGGFVPSSPQHPLTSELTRHTLARVIEGIKIYKEIPNSKLVFTGKGWAKTSEASAMKQLAVKLGVQESDIILEEESKNTLEHTHYLKSLLAQKPFVLVTSAIHMPRAMGLFLKAGYNPIAAPTAHLLLGEYELFNMKMPFASGDNLEAIDLWFNEFFAISLAEFRGQI